MYMGIKIQNISIDSIDKTKKSYVIKEMRKFLKEKRDESSFSYFVGSEDNTLKSQEQFLFKNHKSLVLKENSVLSMLDSHLEEGLGILTLESSFEETLRKEKEIAHRYGSVYFILIPENPIPQDNPLSSSLNLIVRNDFFKNIKSYTIASGLNVELIYFDEDDKIYNIRDKILKVLEEKYTI